MIGGLARPCELIQTLRELKHSMVRKDI